MSRRLLATYVSLAIVVLAVLEIPLGIRYGRTERRDLIHRLTQDALTLATVAEEPLEKGEAAAPASLVAGARRYAEETDARVVIVDAHGLSLVDTSPPSPGRRDFSSRPEIASALRGRVVSGSRRSETLEASVLYVAVPSASGGLVRGAVRITYPASELDHRVLRYWGLLAAIAGIVLVLTAGVGIRFARSLTQPLAHLEAAAEAADGGDLTARAPVDAGAPEIRSLAARFNEMVARLAQLLGSQREFVADASHQLRTPLAALRLRLENLERDTRPEGHADLEGARGEVERLSRLVDGLLALARADAGQAAPASIDLAAAAEERIAAWRHLASDRGVSISHSVAPGLRARATPGHLEQVLDNLLSNALDAAPRGTEITVSGASAGSVAELHIADRGPGMSAGERERAFDRFWRAGRAGAGSGLGLAIVKRLVTADGGEVALAERPGGGLDAIVRLPLSLDPPSGVIAGGSSGRLGRVPVPQPRRDAWARCGNAKRTGRVQAASGGRSPAGKRPRRPRRAIRPARIGGSRLSS